MYIHRNTGIISNTILQRARIHACIQECAKAAAAAAAAAAAGHMPLLKIEAVDIHVHKTCRLGEVKILESRSKRSMIQN